MEQRDANRPLDKVLAYGLPLLVLVHDLLTMILLRSDKAAPIREQLRGWHYFLGTALFQIGRAHV